MNRALLIGLALCLLFAAATAEPLAPAGPGAAAPNATAPSNVSAGEPAGRLSTDLVQLLDPAARLPGQSRETVARSLREQRALRGTAGVRGPGAEEVYVYVSLDAGSPTALVDPFARNVVGRDEEHGLATAWIAPDRLLALASQSFVRSVRTVRPPRVDTGSVTSEGDALLGADLFRNRTGLSGAGVAVGIVSDGVGTWTASRVSGDLPADLHVLSDTVGGDEGTAMAEIVYDLAPDASLWFHDMGDDHLEFMAAIEALADAGCDVIVDDVYWLDDPYFEDGPIAQYIDELVRTRNIVYVTSAGNRAQRHYQGRYVDAGGTLGGWHDFSNGTSSVYRQLYVEVPAGGDVEVALQWDDRFGLSANNYDLYLAGYSTGTTVASSLSVQDGDDDPLESVYYRNNGTASETLAIWVRSTAAAPATLEVYAIPGDGSFVYTVNLVAADSVHGHKAAAEAISVAAAPVSAPTALEPFSSRGPVTIRWPSPELRQKPDIADPDGVRITGAGGFGTKDGTGYRFYGTSASAPHVAALAALAWSGNASASADRVRSALYSTALDRGPVGFDDGWGYGWPDLAAFAGELGVGPAVLAVPDGAGAPTDTNGDGLYDDVNGNGRKDFADVVLFFNSMSWIAANEPVAAFDCNGNGRIDFSDVVWLFTYL